MTISLHERRDTMRTQSRAEAESIFRLAGFAIVRMWELANGYWPDAPDYDDVRTPWWLLLTEIGLVQIGWRKRVLHIQWDQCAFRGLVTEENVTKAETYVHAYSVEKAIEYLRTLQHEHGGRGREDAERPSAPQAAPGEVWRGHSGGCASTRGSGGDGCDCGWTR